jgi:methylated-DNA-[protein]-cysteine S-methyltransferase
MKLSAVQRKQITPFRAKVFDALLEVPAGKVTTYKRLAEKIDCKSSQAIGQALRHNPFAPEVPCHRVVKSDRSIGGFGGFTKGAKIDQKIQLLDGEGVRFISGSNGSEQVFVDDSCLYKF